MIFNEKEVHNINEDYRFGCRVFPNSVLVTTNVDEWLLEKILKHDAKTGKKIPKIAIFHLNKATNRNGKYDFHKQRIVRNLEQAFDVIDGHEDYSFVFDKAFKMKDNFELLN